MIVDEECGVDEIRFDVELNQVVDELSAVAGGIELKIASFHLGDQRFTIRELFVIESGLFHDGSPEVESAPGRFEIDLHIAIVDDIGTVEFLIIPCNL